MDQQVQAVPLVAPHRLSRIATAGSLPHLTVLHVADLPVRAIPGRGAFASPRRSRTAGTRRWRHVGRRRGRLPTETAAHALGHVQPPSDAMRRSGKSVGLGHHGPVRSVLMGHWGPAPRMHSMMHLVWSAIPLFSAAGRYRSSLNSRLTYRALKGALQSTNLTPGSPPACSGPRAAAHRRSPPTAA